jgi:hypothetical protein
MTSTKDFAGCPGAPISCGTREGRLSASVRAISKRDDSGGDLAEGKGLDHVFEEARVEHVQPISNHEFFPPSSAQHGRALASG